MRPVVDIIHRPHCWEIVCNCGDIFTREAWADADQLARNHLNTHLRQAGQADRAETAALVARAQIRSVSA